MDKSKLTIGREVDLKAEWQRTLEDPGLGANALLRCMYAAMDLLYGRGRSLEKFMVLEVLARYPYWAWETGSYHRLSRSYTGTAFADKAESDRAVRHIELGRHSQDNEQWHLFIIEDLMRQKGIPRSYVRHFLLPRVMVIGYHQLTRLLYRFKPAWSFSLNARFEWHAEHEYAWAVRDHPEWEDEPVETEYFQYYPRQATLADLFRRISLDERDHKLESMEEYREITGRDLS